MSRRNPAFNGRMPRPLLSVIEREAARTGQSRSALVRELVVAELMRRGAWPPPVERDNAR